MDISVLLNVKRYHDEMVKSEERYLELKSSAERTTSSITGMPSNFTEEHKKEDRFLEFIRAEDEYYSAVKSYLEHNVEAVQIIDNAELNAKEYAVIYGRLIHFKDWKTIATETGQTMRNCQLLYKKTIERLQRQEERL